MSEEAIVEYRDLSRFFEQANTARRQIERRRAEIWLREYEAYFGG